MLVFDYALHPDAGTHIPGGGVEVGERIDIAAVREAVEETGVAGSLEFRGVLGVQEGTHDTGQPYISVSFHLDAAETRDAWTHIMVGDDGVWDTGLEVNCRFVALHEAGPLLRSSWGHQDEFLDLLSA
ncbi:NUDIX domain-containing protein [Actinoplanes sp. NPDC049596]|uniref:NUDIX domain-containing protein n=1 Tax=unclassified Actinoplanes TaxID=2626549 RepID=UPI0034467603